MYKMFTSNDRKSFKFKNTQKHYGKFQGINYNFFNGLYQYEKFKYLKKKEEKCFYFYIIQMYFLYKILVRNSCNTVFFI